jgi:ABC-2 type transport system permease protein
MRRALVVAGAEFQAAVRSKAFIISLIAMPVLMLGSILAQRFIMGRVDTTPRRFAIIDHSGQVHEALVAMTLARNAAVAAAPGRPARGGPFMPEVVSPGPDGLDALRLELSERVLAKDLFAFVEIPPGVMRAEGEQARLSYHSDEPTFDDVRQWLELSVSEIVRIERLRAVGADAEVIARLTRPLEAESLGLWTRGEGGTIEQARPVDKVRTFLVPIVLMFMVFMIVMTSAPMLLNSVLEEKMSRISEVLLGSVTPFELMFGKLIGAVGVAVVLGVLYISGGLGVARYLGFGNVLPLSLAPFLLVFLVLAIFFYGSLYIAVGAACSDLKDAQSLMMPVVVLTMLPIMAWTAVLRAPNGSFSVGASLFPPATPFLMLLRLALHPGPPAWQVALSVVLTFLATVGCVWAAGKIFRTGVLMQGKSASIGQMIRWVLAR